MNYKNDMIHKNLLKLYQNVLLFYICDHFIKNFMSERLTNHF